MPLITHDGGDRDLDDLRHLPDDLLHDDLRHLLDHLADLLLVILFLQTVIDSLYAQVD